jgi:hypothetical protein
VLVTVAALACLVVFWISAIPVASFERYALNVAAGTDGKPIELPDGHGALLPFGAMGACAALPFAVWLFLAIELQAVSFIVLRLRFPDLARPCRAPFGIPGAVVTLAIALLTLTFQLLHAVFAAGVLWTGVWFALGISWFALVGRHRLVLAPAEAFALGVSARQ